MVEARARRNAMLSTLIFAAVTASRPLPATAPDTQMACRMKGAELATARPDASVSVRKLNELPNADNYLAVVRMDEHGCPNPIIVRYDIGGTRRR
jgi:hypothetical protein